MDIKAEEAKLALLNEKNEEKKEEKKVENKYVPPGLMNIGKSIG